MTTIEKFIQKYGEKDGIKKFRYSRSLECCILKYGEIEGKNRYVAWRESIKKSLKEMPLPKKLEMLKKISVTSTGRVSKWHNTEEDYIKKYGKDEGVKRYKLFLEKIRKNSLRGEKISRKMHYINTKQYYIDTYGENEGEMKYKLWCKSQDHGSVNFFIKKYGEIEGKERYIQVNLKKALNKSQKYFSRISQELFHALRKHLGEDVLYATHGGELALYYQKDGKPCKSCYDFCFKDKIIEYNGDWFHRNSKYYDSTLPENKEIIERDKEKIQLAIDRGFKVLVVWDSEYKVEKEKVLEKCLAFLTN